MTRKQPPQTTRCVAVVWVVTNCLLMLVGGAFAILGVVLKAKPDMLATIYQPDLSMEMGGYIPDEVIPGGKSPPITTNKETVINFDEIFPEFVIACLALGCTMFLFSFLALFVPHTKLSKMFLVLYSIVYLLVGIALSAGLIFYYSQTKELTLSLKKDAKEMLIKHYKGDWGKNAHSIFINYVQRRFRCCGVDDSADFEKAKYSGVRAGKKLAGRYESVKIPWSCCSKRFTKLCKRKGFTQGNSHKLTGCFEEVKNATSDYVIIILVSMAGLVLLIFFTLTIAFMLM